jgi:hypothetical protein
MQSWRIGRVSRLAGGSWFKYGPKHRMNTLLFRVLIGTPRTCKETQLSDLCDPEVIKINTALSLFMPPCISSSYQCFILCSLNRSPYRLKHWYSPIGLRRVNIPKTIGLTLFIENLSPSDIIISTHWTMPKAAQWLTQVVACLSSRSPVFSISVSNVAEEPAGLVFMLDDGNLKSPRNAGENFRN